MKKSSWILLSIGFALLLILGIIYSGIQNTKIIEASNEATIVKTSLLGDKIFNIYTKLHSTHMAIRGTIDITNDLSSIFPPGIPTPQAIQILRNAGLQVDPLPPRNVPDGSPLWFIQSKDLIIGTAIIDKDWFYEIDITIILHPSSMNMSEGYIDSYKAILTAVYL
jgi:hypothetical protein